MIKEKLVHLCNINNIPWTTFFHPPTRSAAETQTVLPEGCLVQKTITSKLADKSTNKSCIMDGCCRFSN